MSDTNLHGILNMPPELWRNDEKDKMQRYDRYVQASRRIEDLDRKLDQAIDMLDTASRAYLLAEWAKTDA